MEKEIEDSRKKNEGIGQVQGMPKNAVMQPFPVNYGYIPAYPMQGGFMPNPYQVNQNPGYFQQNHPNFQNPFQPNFYPMGVPMGYPMPGMQIMPQFIPNGQIPNYARVGVPQVQERKEVRVEEDKGRDYVKKDRKMKTYRKKKNIGKSVDVRQVPGIIHQVSNVFFKEKKVEKKRLGEERLCTSGLLNPTFTSQEEIDKWLKARRKNFPTRKNIEEKKRKKEMGEAEGELDEEELSRLEYNLRKKIMILTADPREERRRKKEMRFLFKNLTCIKKRKPIKKGDGKKQEKEKRVKKKFVKAKEAKPEGNNDKEEDKESEDDDAAPIEISAKKEEAEELSGGEIQLDLEVDKLEEGEVKPDGVKVKAQEPQLDPKAKAVEAKKEQPAVPHEGKEFKKRKKHTSDEMIQHLLKKREEEENLIQNFLQQKNSSNRFRYQQNTLLTSLLLDEVHKERSLMLKTLRYIKQHNFLQKS